MSPFAREFMETLWWRPRQALAGLFWHLTGRKVRAMNRLRHDWHLAPDAYARWCRLREGDAGGLARLADASARWAVRPVISVLADGEADPARLAGLFAALAGQPWSGWELLIPGAALPPGLAADPRLRPCPAEPGETGLEAALRTARGTHLLPLAPGGLLPAAALLRWAEALQQAPAPVVGYADEDRIAADGTRSAPWLKPAWCRELLLAQDYLSGACLLAVDAARGLLPLTAGQRQDPLYAVLLALTGGPGAGVLHLPHVLCHRPDWRLEQGQEARRAVLADHLGAGAEAVTPGPFGSCHVTWPLPDPAPLVSIVVPTRDKAHLLRACLSSLLEQTTWPAYEVLVIDNNSEEAETFACFAHVAQDPRVRVLADPRPYNFSALNNHAVAQARGAYLCLLNNDTEVIAPDWLTELMRQATRPHVGAVGARLLYPDGTIQHAGVVVGMGNAAGHAHRTLRADDPGYFAQAHLAREATAVTAACLVVERRKFDAVGGLDEQGLAIAYNDVDLCLKLRAAGWTNIYAPTALLYHHESVSRGDDFAPEHNARYLAELKVLQQRWHTETFVDPLHHPLLDRSTDQYAIAFRMDR